MSSNVNANVNANVSAEAHETINLNGAREVLFLLLFAGLALATIGYAAENPTVILAGVAALFVTKFFWKMVMDPEGYDREQETKAQDPFYDHW